MFVSSGMAGLGGWPGRAEILQGCSGLRGMAGKAEMCRAGGHSPAKWSSCRAVQVLDMRPGRDCAGLCRPGGLRGLVEIVNVCGSLALRAHPMDILVF
jgi:hypothetical protein